MSVLIKHFRGNRKDFDQSKHGEGIYFATDTNEIILNGEAFGKSNLVEYKLECDNLIVNNPVGLQEVVTLNLRALNYTGNNWWPKIEGIVATINTGDVLEVKGRDLIYTDDDGYDVMLEEHTKLVVLEKPILEGNNMIIKAELLNKSKYNDEFGVLFVPWITAETNIILRKSFWLPEIKYKILRKSEMLNFYDFPGSGDKKVIVGISAKDRDYFYKEAKIGDFIIFPNNKGCYKGVNYQNMPLIGYISELYNNRFVFSAINHTILNGVPGICPRIEDTVFYHVEIQPFELPNCIITNKEIWSTSPEQIDVPGDFDFLSKIVLYKKEIDKINSRIEKLENAASW